MLSSCATSKPPQAFRNTDNAALIILSFDHRTCPVIAPTAASKGENALVLKPAESLVQHQTAVVILENYSETPLGPQFRDRTFDRFLELRGLGYQHIYSLQGKGVPDPDNLTTLAAYE